MTTKLTRIRTILAASLMLIPWVLPGPSLATSQEIREATPSVFKHGIEQIATGSAEDTLRDCLARIPNDTSEGQRKLAVDTCKQEEVVRTLSRIDF